MVTVPDPQVVSQLALDEGPEGVDRPEGEHVEAEDPAAGFRRGVHLHDRVQPREHPDVAGTHDHERRPPRERSSERLRRLEGDRQGEERRGHHPGATRPIRASEASMSAPATAPIP